MLAIVLAAFVAGHGLGYEPSVVALLGAGLLVAVTRVRTEVALQDVEWATLAFFMGLFVMVGGLVNTGCSTPSPTPAPPWPTRTCPPSPSRCCGAPAPCPGSSTTSRMWPPPAPSSPRSSATTTPRQVLWWSLALGADLGGNSTLIGASANIVVAGIAARHGAPISFWQFTRYGLVVTVVTLAISTAYVWLRYFTLTGL